MDDGKCEKGQTGKAFPRVADTSKDTVIFSAPPKKLSEEVSDKLRVILGISSDLEYAYKLKNDLRELMRSCDYNAGKRLLADWVYFAESSGLKEFSSCAKAIHNWSNEILASFDCPNSNGYT